MDNPNANLLLAASPLQAKQKALQKASGADVALTEICYLTQISLRGDANDKRFKAGVKNVLGLALPSKANMATEKGEVAILWLGPDEWLIVASGVEADEVIIALRDQMPETFFAATDVSDNRAVLSLSGKKSWQVLSKCSSLDFHPKSWKKGKCVSSLLGSAQAIFWMKSTKPEISILIRNSFAGYASQLLMDAMQEFADES